MDHRYFEYHKIVETFLLGQQNQEVAAEVEKVGDITGNQDSCPDCQRRLRMKQAFINAFRDEMQSSS